MSKKENHWYLFAAMLRPLGKSARPGVWTIGLWLVLVALLAIGFQARALEGVLKNASSPGFVPIFAFVVVGLAFGATLALRRWRQSALRAEYLSALKHAGPEKLIDVVAAAMKHARALPDADAFSAQSRAIAYALYGNGREAMSALAEVSWGGRAPLVQAVGLSAEGIVELLCRRDARRALELHTKARALASVSSSLPGAAQSERHHGACIAVCEALLNTESPTSLNWLEEAAADARFPQLQLLASFGLAAALDHAGNVERASQLRAQIDDVAPHCGPLHLEPTDFSPSDDETPALPTPVSSSLHSTGSPGSEGIQERFAKKTLIRRLVVLGLWVLLTLMFVAIGAFLVPAK